MNKSQLLYNTTPEFDSNKNILDNKRHYTAETLDNKYIHFKEHKVELPIKDITESVAADICIVDNGGNKYIVDGNSYNIDLFPLEQYTPIGVVVVPASHTDDGTAKIISLASMDYNNPDNGNTDGNVNIYWGGDKSDVPNLLYLTYAPYIADSVASISSPQTLVGFRYAVNYPELCSDYFVDMSGSYPNPFDNKAAYGSESNDSDDDAAPSPYLNDGSKNPIYHSIENTGNAYADMDGKSNTEKILAVDNGSLTDWQTAPTIQNTGTNDYIHPAAQCCWRYHTVGTNQGDWYLPSAGELGYLASRWKVINSSIDKLISLGVSALVLPVNGHWWSSTEYSITDAVLLYFNSKYVSLGYSLKYYGSYYVRAFLSV